MLRRLLEDHNTELLLQIAKLYYVEHRSQKEISGILNVSQSTVSRLMKEAHEAGFIRILIGSEFNEKADLSEEEGGYIVLNIPDEYIPFFQDLMNGFVDYARARGYEVRFSSDVSVLNRIKFRFTILDEYQARYRDVGKDLEDYLSRLQGDSSLGDLNIPKGMNEEQYRLALLVAQHKIISLRSMMQLQRIQIEAMAPAFRLLTEKSFSHTPTQNFYLNAGGAAGSFTLQERVNMGDRYTTGQAGSVGPYSHAHNMSFNQLWSQTGQSVDLQALAMQLATLRQHLRKEAAEPEHDVAISAIAKAEMAAKEGNGPKTFEWLSKAGKWTLDNAAKIGVGIATAALKTALGL